MEQQYNVDWTEYWFIIRCVIAFWCLTGDLVVQGTYDCGSAQFPKVVRVTDRNEETIFSQTNQYYDSRRDCILTIIGKRNYQLELELTSIDIDEYAYTTEHCGGLCCSDYLKIFNSEYRKIFNSKYFNIFISQYLKIFNSEYLKIPQLVYQRPWYVLFCLWKSAYKRSLAAYRKE